MTKFFDFARKLKIYHWLIIGFIGAIIIGLGVGYTADQLKNKNIEGTKTQITSPKVEETQVEEPKPTETKSEPIKSSSANTPNTQPKATTPAVNDYKQYLPQLYEKKTECEKVISDQDALLTTGNLKYDKAVANIDKWYSETLTGTCSYSCGDAICGRSCHSTEDDALYKQKKDNAYNTYEEETGLTRKIRNTANDFLIKIKSVISVIESHTSGALWGTLQSKNNVILEKSINDIMNNNTDL